MKLRHIRPFRLAIRGLSFIREHINLIALVLLLTLVTALGITGFRFLSQHNVTPQDLLGFFGKPSQNLDSTNDVTNFLLLGIRGEGSDSPLLTDTMIIFSYNHVSQTPTIISIPRDLWVPSLKTKINTTYLYGEEASPGAGIKMTQAAILEDLGLPIHYTAVIDFAVFKQAIDLVSGVDVEIAFGFTDSEFPIPGRENALPISSRYESITFATGSAHLDGEMALKFVRSRHSYGDEGTDFARSRRQQQVISALRQKMVTPSFLLDQKKVNSLLEIISSNLKTNFPDSLYPTLAKLALDTKDKDIKFLPLTNLPDANGVTILYNPPARNYGGQWVLVAKDNNWTALKQYIKNNLSEAQ